MCIKLINKHFPDVHVVKGRSWHPQSQGGIEHGNAPFKEALQKWMQANNNNWPLGIYYVNVGMNQCPSCVKGNMSPYSIYYGQKVWSQGMLHFMYMGDVAQTEYGSLVSSCLQRLHMSTQQCF